MKIVKPPKSYSGVHIGNFDNFYVVASQELIRIYTYSNFFSIWIKGLDWKTVKNFKMKDFLELFIKLGKSEEFIDALEKESYSRGVDRGRADLQNQLKVLLGI
jgi:hypothetical protein